MSACLSVSCTEALAATALRLHPSLQQLREGQGLGLGRPDAATRLGFLLAQCELQYAHARADYWPTRVWRQLTWQPVYLAVAAVHGFAALAPLQSLLQVYSASGVGGYRWLAAPVRLGDEALALQLTAGQLATCADQLLALLQQQRRVSAANCRGLLADCIFFALQTLAPQLEQGDHWIAEQGEHWCRHASLLDRRGQPLSCWQPATGRLLRRSCCKTFLVGEQTRCDSCPL